MKKTVNFIRGLYKPFDLCVQLPVGSKEDMPVIVEPLLKSIEGAKGFLYTSFFQWSDLEIVKKYFEDLGYEIILKDEREKERMLNYVLGRS